MKSAKIKPPRNICRIQYLRMECMENVCYTNIKWHSTGYKVKTLLWNRGMHFKSKTLVNCCLASIIICLCVSVICLWAISVISAQVKSIGTDKIALTSRKFNLYWVKNNRNTENRTWINLWLKPYVNFTYRELAVVVCSVEIVQCRLMPLSCSHACIYFCACCV